MPFKARLSALLALASCSAACLLQEPARAAGDEPVAADLASLSTLSIEELLRTEVSSVLKHPSELAQAPAATTVLRREDIQRLGATTLPDLLRTVPGLHVAQIDGNKWGVSARGFNGFFGGKLLVLIDGRSIYNSIYSGVFWDAYDIALDDIARIEVVRGPGNALNLTLPYRTYANVACFGAVVGSFCLAGCGIDCGPWRPGYRAMPPMPERCRAGTRRGWA